MFKEGDNCKRLIYIFSKLFCNFGKAPVYSFVDLWFSKG